MDIDWGTVMSELLRTQAILTAFHAVIILGLAWLGHHLLVTLVERVQELKLHQLEGIKFALENEAVILGDDMGLGKTPQALATVQAAQAERVVIVAPKGLLENWAEEIQNWLGDQGQVHVVRDGAAEKRIERIEKAKRSGTKFIIVNYQALRNQDIVSSLKRYCRPV